MQTSLVPSQSETQLIQFSQEKVELIKRTVAKGATNDELELFLYQAKKSGLDPLARQIYFRKYKNQKTGKENVSIITGIDGYRLIADRTGKYAGNDDAIFEGKPLDADWKAIVTVWKLIAGQRCPFTASARWSQFYPGDAQGFQWKRMPHHMLAKCAESIALRKAFPSELSGLDTQEEMEQADTKENDGPKLVGETKLEPSAMKKEPDNVDTRERIVTAPQLKRLWAISKDREWTTEDCKAAINIFFGKDSSKLLTWEEYDHLVNYIEANSAQTLYENSQPIDSEIPNPFEPKES